MKYFGIEICDKLRPSVDWGMKGLASLQFFTIRGSEDVLEKLLKEQLLPTTLRTLMIFDVPTLKSLDGKGLQHLTSLQRLHISNCPSIEFLAKEGLQHLTSLQRLVISNLSTLKSLDGKGLQHLTSLQRLHISDCPSLEFLAKERLQHLTSLQCLYISNCPSLEFLAKEGLQHLTCLQRLQISNCPSLEFLIEEGNFPQSLRLLCIINCSSSLGKRWQNNTGKDWGKVAHIPCIKIDDQVFI